MYRGWIVRVWCPSCCGQDMQGCFDGDVAFLAKRGEARWYGEVSPRAAHVFSSYAKADVAAKSYTKDTIWEYQIEPINDESGLP